MSRFAPLAAMLALLVVVAPVLASGPQMFAGRLNSHMAYSRLAFSPNSQMERLHMDAQLVGSDSFLRLVHAMPTKRFAAGRFIFEEWRFVRGTSKRMRQFDATAAMADQNYNTNWCSTNAQLCLSTDRRFYSGSVAFGRFEVTWPLLRTDAEFSFGGSYRANRRSGFIAAPSVSFFVGVTDPEDDIE